MKANLQLQPSLRKSWRSQRWAKIIVAGIIVVLVVGGLAGWLGARNLSVHSTLPDPAAPSVMRYIQAHEALNALAAVDPATRSVLDYLRIHINEHAYHSR